MRLSSSARIVASRRSYLCGRSAGVNDIYSHVHTALPPVPVNNLRPARIRPRLYNPNPNNVPHPVLPHAMALSRCSRRPFTTPCSVRGRSRGYHDEIFGFRKSREYVFPDCALPLFAGALIRLLITLSCMHRYPCPIGEPRRQRIVTALC